MSISDLLFDTPWWILVLLIAGGGYVWYLGNGRMDKTIKLVGLAAILAGVVLIVLSAMVATPKEEVATKTKLIVRAFVDRDWSKLKSLVPERVSVDQIYNNRSQLIAGGRKTVDVIGLKDASITSMDVTQNDTVITATLTILSTQEATLDRPTPTNWRFDWENLGNGWILDRIEPLEGRQVTKNDLMAHMSK